MSFSKTFVNFLPEDVVFTVDKATEDGARARRQFKSKVLVDFSVKILQEMAEGLEAMAREHLISKHPTYEKAGLPKYLISSRHFSKAATCFENM